ncbi:unnamed protein product [Chilo suppressalis]|uniref:Nuclear respiratory factor 1 NLS/DNA-binding dimerisation domain-containing protein n=1 Tax=Chilo suppressalis TaxID=168631 RepID=A0ABN8BE86_CHISP|nr:unnamed protein product [Chilo suppressalis]
MIANLPLLFASGNPTALSKISAKQLEKFITFMVTCSWGHDTAKDIRQPPWWPKDVTFSHPFVRPIEVPKDWEARLKNLVKRCYEFHKSSFLLVFSAQLARYPRNRLRYVDNRDHTTSLYYRPSGRLLVTFRNENINYDRDVPIDLEDSPHQLPPPPADIYLCDSCDNHFDSLELLTAHERLCNIENAGSNGGGLPEFLSALKLQPIGSQSQALNPKNCQNEIKPRNARSAANIDRGPPYPFSSLAYMRNAKSNIQRDTSYSRERIERYCSAPFPVNKTLVSKTRNQQFPVRYRRPIDYWYRRHTFPNQRNKRILDLKGQLLLLKCRPVSVDIELMTEKGVQDYIENLKQEAERRRVAAEKDVIYVDGLEYSDLTSASETKDPLNRLEECEVIDLCSDDEGGSVNENCDPRAGIACVMRGGAVLRRAVPPATPRQLPAEPCGARHRPLPVETCGIRHRPLPGAVLQPHPVILIAHTLNHLQTISLE